MGSLLKIFLFSILVIFVDAYVKPVSLFRKEVILDYNLKDRYDVEEFLRDSSKEEPQIGVYAVADDEDGVTYIGISNDIGSDIKKMKEKLHDDDIRLKSIRVQSFDNSPETEVMLAYRNELVRQIGGEPEGNKEGWLGSSSSGSSGVINFDEDEEATNTNNLAALTSAINKNRELTETASSSAVETTEQIVSPFSEESITPSDGKGLEFNVENVDKVLDEIRPYLVADGGNVAIASLDNDTRDVRLILQGACGSCPSSTTTMKMGIERVLKENFINLGDVIAVEDPNAPLTESLGLDLDTVRAALGRVLPAVQGMGGTIDDVIVDADLGIVTMKYAGPEKLKQGVEMVLKENPIITEVIFQDM